jgi:hypothetical protein
VEKAVQPVNLKALRVVNNVLHDFDPQMNFICPSNVVVNHVFWQTFFASQQQVDRKKNIFSTSDSGRAQFLTRSPRL